MKAFWVAYGPTLAEWAGSVTAWGILSLVNGVLRHGAAGNSSPMVRFFSALLDRLSLSTRKDSPNSVKLPLSASKPPPLPAEVTFPTAEVDLISDEEETPTPRYR